MAGRPQRRYARNGTPLEEAADPNTPVEVLAQLAKRGQWPLIDAILQNPVLPLLDLEDPRIGMRLGYEIGWGCYKATKAVPAYAGMGTEPALQRLRMARGSVQIGMAQGITRLAEDEVMTRLRKTVYVLGYQGLSGAWALFARHIGSRPGPAAQLAKRAITQTMAQVGKAWPDREKLGHVFDEAGDALWAASRHLQGCPEMEREAVGVIANEWSSSSDDWRRGGSQMPFNDAPIWMRKFWHVAGDDPPPENWPPYLALWLELHPQVVRFFKRIGIERQNGLGGRPRRCGSVCSMPERECIVSKAFGDFHGGDYQLAYIDPPWKYSGSATKDQAAGKHYEGMTVAAMTEAFPMKKVLAKKAWAFMLCTGPKMAEGVDLLRAWGLHFRGVGYVWIKTRADGCIIGGQGARPSHVKSLSEFVLVGGTHPTGRLLPILTEKQHQVVLAPRPDNRHSAKPPEVRRRLEELFGPVRRLEMFAREAPEGWSAFGDQVPGL